MARSEYVTTTRALDRAHPAMRLYEKAKRLGIWNPSEIDLGQDRRDWETLDGDEKDLILRLCALFQAGEEAVTLDILPLIQVIASEGRLEEELFLAAFLFEEAKHTDFFGRFLDEVAGAPADLARYHSDSYRALFYHALPETMQALASDGSPAAQARAATTYNMVVEGVLAETGYHAFLTVLERNHLMPGFCKAIALLKRDEARHIAYGIYLLSRLLAAQPELWAVIEIRMNELLPYAMGVIGDAFSAYDPVPFGLSYGDFVEYASDQFQKRIERLEKARTVTLAEVDALARISLEADE
jgi:ribonucleoside-diphosphate reductase beta chain